MSHFDDAIRELRHLTTCRCEPAWTDRGLHEVHCNQDYAADVETLATLIEGCDARCKRGGSRCGLVVDGRQKLA